MAQPEIELLYFDDCPNWKEADGLLLEAAASVGLLDPKISYRKVMSSLEAEEMGFRGSPTILIDGRDPFADAGTPAGLSCRVYRSEGRTSGSPSLDQIRDALRSALDASPGRDISC